MRKCSLPTLLALLLLAACSDEDVNKDEKIKKQVWAYCRATLDVGQPSEALIISDVGVIAQRCQGSCEAQALSEWIGYLDEQDVAERVSLSVPTFRPDCSVCETTSDCQQMHNFRQLFIDAPSLNPVRVVKWRPFR